MRADQSLTGEDVYVVASGATIDHIDPGFFTGKHVVAVNRAAERLGLYDQQPAVTTVSHYIFEDAVPLAEAHPDHHVYAPIHDQGHAKGPTGPDLPNVTYYPHHGTDYQFTPQPWGWPEGGLLMGSTSLHAAMHLACRMGAANVIVVGADCGVLDGKTNHGTHPLMKVPDSRSPLDVLARWEDHLRAVKAVLVACYGVRIYSLSPFLNPNMEGHTWDSLRSPHASHPQR
jgi:hypothetical protein